MPLESPQSDFTSEVPKSSASSRQVFGVRLLDKELLRMQYARRTGSLSEIPWSTPKARMCQYYLVGLADFIHRGSCFEGNWMKALHKQGESFYTK